MKNEVKTGRRECARGKKGHAAETCRDEAAQWSPEELQQVGEFK